MCPMCKEVTVLQCITYVWKNLVLGVAKLMPPRPGWQKAVAKFSSQLLGFKFQASACRHWAGSLQVIHWDKQLWRVRDLHNIDSVDQIVHPDSRKWIVICQIWHSNSVGFDKLPSAFCNRYLMSLFDQNMESIAFGLFGLSKFDLHSWKYGQSKSLYEH